MATKEAYQQKWKAQLDEWDAKLDVLTAKAQKATAELRISCENELSAASGTFATQRRTKPDTPCTRGPEHTSTGPGDPGPKGRSPC